ncbi:GntR family transcriptional regulator/MocR family aminotransferase [Mobilisporobacter senegalensis]|uniref:GntR family transcriptional regulator/MocR family aminotransferase n=1 Tax=Mobilisporobacter senegalensis TaxID=1329262 RepID=A0A3N1XW20_9FIRM|nr:PLP-dependent aminotransferase family protein [Mobilisporobacter senegalensis]ROR30825.1 GntR family transcriptional regulator/MocR family aminotransferase [Mobilisporobacter senegalensis]
MFTIHLNSKSETPLYEQIYQYIKNEIKIGALAYGEKLPSTRSLAAHLQVSRNTIDMAYGQLSSEGYIESKEKKGYFVNEVTEFIPYTSHKKISKFVTSEKKEKYKYDFSPFAIDINSFPYNTWRKLSKNVLLDNNDIFLQGLGQGDDQLRAAIGKYLHESRNVNCTREQIIVGAGIDYLLQLLLQLLPDNSKIAMENPSYKKAYKIFTGLNYPVTPIELDSSGISIHELSNLDINVAYVTPSHQYPIGIVMPIKRRLELLNWAASSEKRYIIEDDHDSEFRYKGKPIPALQGLDPHNKVIYLGTFSRAIAPGIRIAYMVLPNDLLKVYQKQYSYYSSTVSRVDQSILTAFIEDGYFERHLNKMRKIYKNKHDLIINSLKIFEDKVQILGENAGLHLVIKMHLNYTESEIVEIGKKNNIKLYGLKDYYIRDPGESYVPTILLGYANMSESEITDGIQLLKKVLM